ncbi:Endo-1,4-beta-xylanase, GH35 family [Chitinophaga rupis]|uniref:Beta-xylanase n=1 Tax=Chitinophaga rupis TaxID=573321 RepID=A0A1H8B0W3_9BACT|nr:endo-1,4-beta-xylanase [Chitinophaga rupis]SEM75744.1 Endo-1,4-beta-xylanase, GH35 family [Chitinophaga rupis]
MKYLLTVTIALLYSLQAAAQDYNILQYGAVNDTTRLSTTAINKAVEACYGRGGGRVVIPAGNFKSGTIILKNNVELHLERGATLYASVNPQDFPQQPRPAYRSQKDPGGWFALIYAAGANNIAITGSGVIDGQGARQQPRHAQPDGDRDGRPRNILFISCNNITVKEVSMYNAGIWNQHYLDCEDVMVDGIKVYNHANRNNDGIDIDGCRRFVLSNSIIDSDDDAIVLKSTGKAGCEDVVINNCITSSFTNAIKCGTESTGGFKRITISNCVVKPSKSKLPPIWGRTNIGITGISLEIVDGGTMEGVNVNNIVIEGTECPVYVRLGNRGRPYMEGISTPAPGIMRDVQLSNITAYNAGNYCSSITGVPGALIENISLNNIHIINRTAVKAGDYIRDALQVPEDEKGYPEPTTWKNLPSSGLFIRHVKNIRLSDVTFEQLNPADARIPLIGVDIEHLFLHNVHYSNNQDKLPAQWVGVTEHATTTTKGLKDYYNDYFPIGVSVSPRNVSGGDTTLILQQFNSLTTENVLKFGSVHPEEQRYNWDGADTIISFAQAHHLKVRGHTLCWHQQTPAWLFVDRKGAPVSKEVLLQRLKEHIFTVMQRYRGKIYAWDVVNEAISDDSTQFLRNSPWYRICGEEFIEKAFIYAHEADPDAILFYNDYNTEHPEKRERIYRLLKKLLDNKVPVQGIGLQAHWNLTDPAQKELIATIERFRALGLQVQITELDISVLPPKSQRDSAWLAQPDAYTPQLEQQQAAQYTSVFNVFRQYKGVLTGVTFWNVSDKYTWLDRTPSAQGRKNYPLLFDSRLRPKKAYYAITEF